MSSITNSAPATKPHPGISAWIKTARPLTLSAALSPILVGSAVAAYHGIFHFGLFVLTLLAGLCLQIAANFYNEYFDFRYGLDHAQSLGASTVIFQGSMSATQVLAGGIAASGVATLLGIVLIALVGPAILLFGITGLAIAYFYSARPFKLATRGLGDVMVFLAMGLLMTWGAYYVQIHHWSWAAFAASIPIGFLVTAILNMNNIRDYEDDLAVHKQTIVVRFGRDIAKSYHTALIAGAYLAVTVFAFGHLLPYLSLLVWLCVLTATGHLRAILPATDRKVYMRGMRQISALHLQFGLLLALGITLATLLHR